MNLRDLFDTIDRDLTPAEQVRFWKPRTYVADIAVGTLIGLTALMAYSQRDGGQMDLHKHVGPYVEHRMRWDPPEQPRDAFHAAMMRKATAYETGKVVIALALCGVLAVPARFCHNKLRAAQAKCDKI